jgi:hypothetical protein
MLSFSLGLPVDAADAPVRIFWAIIHTFPAYRHTSHLLVWVTLHFPTLIFRFRTCSLRVIMQNPGVAPL